IIRDTVLCLIDGVSRTVRARTRFVFVSNLVLESSVETAVQLIGVGDVVISICCLLGTVPVSVLQGGGCVVITQLYLEYGVPVAVLHRSCPVRSEERRVGKECRARS